MTKTWRTAIASHWTWFAVVTIAAMIAVAAVVASAADSGTDGAAPEPLGMSADGIGFVAQNGTVVLATGSSEHTADVIGMSTDTPVVDVYLDWSCPACKSIEAAYGPELAAKLGAGEIALTYHPIAFLDSKFQGSRYSSRAGNAAACVANYAPDRFLDVQSAFFAAQPEEGTSGLTDDEIIALVHQAGVQAPEIDGCIADEAFADWVKQATQRTVSDSGLFNADGRFSTPAVIINGSRWGGKGDLMDAIPLGGAA